jgi:2-polyprenyl-6-hydroxyphenyl methylase/3-demethylubiquinone-9 3-methyltransferase
MTATRDFEQQVSSGQRFRFGRNWRHYLAVLDRQRIAEAGGSLQNMLARPVLQGRSFLDIGTGSGLFSLAAVELGAARVHSFDYDPESVACAEELKRRFHPAAQHWTIEAGNALDERYLTGLGQWDVVYSWGVLHHTGDMWRALNNVLPLVAPGGQLFISIYNDQGGISRRWRAVKRIYNRSVFGRLLMTSIFIPYWVIDFLLADLFNLRNPVSRYVQYKRSRGMSMVHDWLDWLGGYPFEVARPEAVFDFFYRRGFELQRLVTQAAGCNEFVFVRK